MSRLDSVLSIALRSVASPSPSAFIDYERSSAGTRPHDPNRSKVLKKRATEKANKNRGKKQ